jgi:hypothetical protein
MKRSVKTKTDRVLKRTQFVELSEGMEALAEARQGKWTLPIRLSDSGTTKKSEELKVFISLRDSKCDECGEGLGRKAWITLEENKGALCLACADLDELVFLPSGDAALTRRARKHSVLSAVVLKFSRARRRYERQGLLVEENALNQAEAECLADAEARERRAGRERERRAELDQGYVEQFAKRIRELFPACPPKREFQIAEHACRKYSGRIGRSAAAKSFDEAAVLLAVAAHIRHRETNYDELLAGQGDRWEARARVKYEVNEVLRSWQRGKSPLV